jgi:hypothetical protein
MTTRNRPRHPKPATEQPGNSFRYLYWRLSEKEFQQLCAALLRLKFDPVRCFPVGMADEGIDAISDGSTIYQVKWSSKLEQNPDRWLQKAIEGERAKIERLVEQKRISRYILMTSVAGTTTAQGTGSIQKLQTSLDTLSKELGVPIECWWQSDIDAEVDNAPDATKWSYQEMLAGSQAMRYLIEGSQVEGQAARMRDTVLQVMATQWRDDSKIKFSQVDMDRVNVVDLFVDVQTSLREPPRNAIDEFTTRQTHKVYESAGAVEYMLKTPVPLTYLLGVPGQGKSTLGQYLSQIHRAAILPGDMLGDRKPPHESVDDPKLPLRIDLKDYAAWLSGRDPFGDDDPPPNPRRRPKAQRSLELFLADFCTSQSGGRSVTVEDVQSLLARYPTLLVLDGLDEVAESDLRAIVVEQINLTATRMGAGGKLRRFQILVTARPNATGLAEPDKDIFQTLSLEPLTTRLQREFVNKWCDVNDIHGKARRDLRRTFVDRTALDHVAQLADNPMQLTILLFLINRKGDAVPVSRTPLYTDYMTTLLDREVNRKQIDRDQVPRVQEVTAFLGWHMHSGVETKPTAGRMAQRDIESTLYLYFRATEGPDQEAANLFKAASDRFWALTSKVDGTFEFAVQPVREYFAARFLAEWAGRDRREPLPKQQVLQQLIDRNYWLNTARFYAGFAPPNELAGLRYGIEEAIEQARHPLQERVAAWALMSDAIFANDIRVQRDVARLLTDDLSIVLLTSHPESNINFPRLTSANGAEQVSNHLLQAIESGSASGLTSARVDVLRERLTIEKDTFITWWKARLDASVGTPDQAAWLRVGGRFGAPRLIAADAAKLSVTNAMECQAALSAGASADVGTDVEKRLLQAVLDGWGSDVPTTGSSESGSLLRAMRPQWYHQLQTNCREGPAFTTGHLWVTQADRSSRAAALNRLVEIDQRYAALKKAANPRGKGQKDTTEPWQNPARVLCQIHGPSLLAAEIAIAGAASVGTLGSGSVSPGGEPFGPNVDYGTLVIDVHRHPGTAWWRSMHEKFSDSLSRQTWSLALLATADTATVIDHIGAIDACVAALTPDEFAAVAAASSRLGAMQQGRAIGREIWPALISASNRLKLLVSHFAASKVELDPLDALTVADLMDLASPSPSAWPIVRAISARLLSLPTPTLLEALAAAGSEAKVDMPSVAQQLPVDYLDELLRGPGRYPTAWVIAAERWRSIQHAEVPLDQVALEEKWLPKVPRL